MGVMRVERSEMRTVIARPQSATWHAFDLQLVIYTLALAIIGLLMAWTNSSGSPLAPGSTFTRGLMWLAIAIVAFTVTAAFDYRWLRTLPWLLYAVSIGLLVLTLAVGTGLGGAQRWVSILHGIQFQFSEISKILMVAVLAAYLAARRDSIRQLWTLIGAGVLVVPPFVLVMVQPDLGTALVFGAILFGMLFLSGASLRWLTVTAGGLLAAMPVLLSALQDYQRRRLLSFLDPLADPLGSGYQVLQSQIAVGSGGLFGKGLTNGSQAGSDFLPVQSTDFAFAVLLEELGFVGGVVVFILFVCLIWRVLLVGWRAENLFAVAFAAGIGSMILFQLLVNVGMIVGIMPVTGIPLPFITHGGASLISVAIGLGFLQSINMRRSESRTW
jgi:rod shape determining protein RodA